MLESLPATEVHRTCLDACHRGVADQHQGPSPLQALHLHAALPRSSPAAHPGFAGARSPLNVLAIYCGAAGDVRRIALFGMEPRGSDPPSARLGTSTSPEPPGSPSLRAFLVHLTVAVVILAVALLDCAWMDSCVEIVAVGGVGQVPRRLLAGSERVLG